MIFMVDRSQVDEKLELFADEADMNDWAEVVWGAILIGFGFYQMHHPWEIFFLPGLWMKIVSASMIGFGAVLLTHGMMDMNVKEVRRSMVMLNLVEKKEDTPDYGLIRDVIMNPGDYKDILLHEYQLAYADGVLTSEEFDDLNRLADAMGIPWSENARMALRVSIDSALADGVVTDAERALIAGACDRAGLLVRDQELIMEALEDGVIDEREEKILRRIIDLIGTRDEDSKPNETKSEKATDYSSMSVAELKGLLREAGKPVSGKKSDLIARLQE